MKLTIHKKIWIAISVMAILLATTLNFFIYNASKAEALNHAEALIIQTLKSNAIEIETGVGNTEYKLDDNSVELQTLIKNIKPYRQTKAFIINSKGVFLEHSSRSEIGQNIIKKTDANNLFSGNKTLLNKGKNNIIRGKNENNEQIIFASTPLVVENNSLNASIGLIVPIKEITNKNKATNLALIIISMIGLVIMPLFGWFLGRVISSRFTRTQETLNLIAKGDLKNDITILNYNDEIGAINTTTNELIYGLRKAADFAKEMGKGNLKASFESLGKKDTLGEALLNMQQSLLKADKEDRKRKTEDEKQNWATQGLAKFGETLRSNAQNIEMLSYDIVSNLINYLEINQGAMFVVNNEDENDRRLILTAAVAYGRQKFMQKNIPMKAGIVGRCAFEQKTVYMTEIPDDYIEITSGLGTANPSAILLIPLILNDEVFGVLELASFNNIAQYQIDFVEKLGESIASTISTVNTNETTSKLLNQSKSQSEELAAQEEEMRQNLEELQATQEEATRREFEMEGIITALDNTAFTVEYDMSGNIVSANEKYATLLNESLDNIIGTNHAQGYEFDSEKKNAYTKFWDDLKFGKTVEQENKLTIAGKEIWIHETYSPIFEKDETKPYKVLKIGFEVVKNKNIPEPKQEQELKNVAKTKSLEAKIIELQNDLSTAEKKNITATRKSADVATKKKVEPTSTEEVSSKIVTWNSNFELGIEEMDAQHKQLFDLAILLNDSIAANKNKKELKENLRSLIDFASYHFRNEESYFDAFEYENMGEHCDLHAAFIKEISAKQKAYQANKLKDLKTVAAYILAWLTEHFTSTDKLYKNLFKEKGL